MGVVADSSAVPLEQRVQYMAPGVAHVRHGLEAADQLLHRDQHRFRTAGVHHDVSTGGGLQLALQRQRDTSAIARAAVFGGHDHSHASSSKPIEIEQLTIGPGAVDQRHRCAPSTLCFGERRKRREADAAGHALHFTNPPERDHMRTAACLGCSWTMPAPGTGYSRFRVGVFAAMIQRRSRLVH